MTPLTPSPSSGSPDPAGHPDIELLADLAEGLADPATAEELHRHLAGCPECADTWAALAEVSRLLGDDEPPAMPADVAARIDAALAAEPHPAELRATEPRPAEPDAAGPRAAVPAAADRGAPAGGHPGGPSRPGGRPDGTTRPASGPGRARRRRTRRILLGTAVLTAAVTLGSLLYARPWDSGSSAATSAAGSDSGHSAALAPGARSPKAADALPEYREDQLAAQVRQLLGQATGPAPESPRALRPDGGTGATGTASTAPTPPKGSGTDAGSPDNGATTTDGGGQDAATRLPACVALAAGHPGQAPLAAGPGRYGAAAVTALVYPLPGRTDQVDVYLVTPDCPGATVLLHRSVPAP